MNAILDIETGGFSITKNGVCEIAVVVTNQQLEEVDYFHCYIKPYLREDSDELVSYKDDAMAINGILVADLESTGIDVTEAMKGLSDCLKRNNVTTIVGHCVKQFDIPRVEYLLKRFMNESILHLEVKDTMPLAKEKILLASYKLEDLCKYFGVSNMKSHSAHGDAMATLECFRRLN